VKRRIVLWGCCAVLAAVIGCGSKDEQKTQQSKSKSLQEIEVKNPHAVLGDYLKSRAVAYTFQGEIRSTSMRLKPEDRLMVAKEMKRMMISREGRK